MSTDPCERSREHIGLLVLGRLDPEVSIELERHLQACPACRAELEALRGLPAALAMVDPSRLDSEESPPPGLEGRIVGDVEGSRRLERPARRYRRLVPVFAAAAAAAAITAGTFLALDSSPPAVPTEQLTFEDVASGVTVDGQLIAHTWGVEVNLVVTGLADGERYVARLVRRDGSTVSAGTFIGVSGRPIVCKLNGAVLLEDARQFVVTAPGGDVVMEASLAPETA